MTHFKLKKRKCPNAKSHEKGAEKNVFLRWQGERSLPMGQSERTLHRSWSIWSWSWGKGGFLICSDGRRQFRRWANTNGEVGWEVGIRPCYRAHRTGLQGLLHCCVPSTWHGVEAQKSLLNKWRSGGVVWIIGFREVEEMNKICLGGLNMPQQHAPFSLSVFTSQTDFLTGMGLP